MRHLKISDVAEIINGYQVRDKTDFGAEGNISFIQVKDLDRVHNKVSLKKLERLTIDKDMSKYQVRKDDVLFLAKGNIQASLIDSSTFKEDEVYVPMPHFFTLRPAQDVVLTEYLWWILNQKETLISMSKLTRGSMMAFLGKPELETLQIPVPTIAKQKFIIEFARLREKEKELSQKIEQEKDKLYKQLLNGIIEG